MFSSPTARSILMLPTLSALALALFAGTTTAKAAATAHYQKDLALSCLGRSCGQDFPAVGAKQRLHLSRVHCNLVGPAGSTFRLGYIAILNANNSGPLILYLPVDHSSSDGYHTLNQAIDIQVVAGQRVQVQVELVTGETPSSGFCAVTGTLETLQ